MKVSSLARFIDPIKGPIVSLTSAPYPSYFRRYFWHSTAILNIDILARGNFRFLTTCGGGWSKDKLESQVKAITEAVERWAYFYYLNNFQKYAGLDIDFSTTGFAALSWYFSDEEVLLNSYAEAVERWVLSYIWNEEDIDFQEILLSDKKIKKIFSFFKGEIYCYKTSILSDKDIYDGELFFYISLFRLENGGVIVGSACGIDENSLYRSLFELFIHCLAYERMKKKGIKSFEELENVIERRLFKFANDDEGFLKMLKRIRLVKKNSLIRHPKILFKSFLKGPWEPEIKVSRVILEGINEFNSDDENKLVI